MPLILQESIGFFSSPYGQLEQIKMSNYLFKKCYIWYDWIFFVQYA